MQITFEKLNVDIDLSDLITILCRPNSKVWSDWFAWLIRDTQPDRQTDTCTRTRTDRGTQTSLQYYV